MKNGWLACLTLVALVTPAFAQTTSAPSSAPDAEQDAVVNQLKALPVGLATLDAYQLPDEYLRRFADRALRAAFESQFRIVVRDRGAAPPPLDLAPVPVAAGPPSGPGLYYLAPIAIFIVVVVVVAFRGGRTPPR